MNNAPCTSRRATALGRAALAGAGLAACLFARPASAETWTFVEPGGDNNYWNKSNCWLSQEGATNGVPQTGDCLEILVKPSSMHRANNDNRYMKKIHFGPNAGQNIAHQGFYLQGVEEGGEGLLFEPYSGFSLWGGIRIKGTATVDFPNGGGLGSCFIQAPNGSTARLIKLGTGYLSTSTDGTLTNWRGADLHEGTIVINTVKDLKSADFYFCDTKAKAYLKFGCTANIAGGCVHSTTNELPLTDHGLTDDGNYRTLTLSGASPVDEQYFEGALMSTLTFCWNPTDAAKRFTFARAASPTKGSVIVQNGVVSVTNGASFTALTSFRVEGTGVLDIATDAGALKNVGQFTFADSGRIRLNGQELKVQSAFTNGVKLAFGSYTAAELPCIDGEGTLNVDPHILYVDPITLEVAEGETKTLAEALADYTAAHADDPITVADLNGGTAKARTLAKTGKGLLNLDTAIKAYTGAVYVEEGVVNTVCRYALGAESGSVVYVRAGATFTTATDLNMNVSRTFHIAGTGAGKVGSTTYSGALYCNRTVSGYGNQHAFGSTIILDDDATVRLGEWMFCGSNALFLNRHTLTAVGVYTDDSPFFLPPNIMDDGRIAVIGGQWKNNSPTYFQGTDPGNTVVFGNCGGYRFAGYANAFQGAGASAWKFIFNGPNMNIYADYNLQPRDYNANVFPVKTEMNGLARLWFQGDRRRGFAEVAKPISGTGGFAATGNRTIYLHMISGDNTFTGGFDFTRGTIWAYANGAIPNGPDAGKVRLAPTAAPYDAVGYENGKINTSTTFHNTFDGVAFMKNVTYALPDLEAVGTFPSRVQGGRGAWRKVTQAGKGLDYYSGLGGDLLDIEAGYVKLPRGTDPGLWEGETTTGAENAYATTVTYTNYAVRGPTAIIPYEAYNYTSWKNNELITYSGYVWNRTAADATWAFALAPKEGSAKLLVNGETVVEGDATAPKAGNVVLKPGANRFECRLLNAKGARAASATWPEYFGCAYDPLGRGDVSVTNNFVRAVDTGDGSLFTRTVDDVAGLPAFGAIRLAAGTSLDVNGNRYAAADISGAGTVTNSATDALAAPALVISKSVTANAAEKGTLVVAVPLEFGPDFKVSVTNCSRRARGNRRLIVAEAPITGKVTSIPVEADDGHLWSATVSADGCALDLRREGLQIILR